MAFVVTPDQEVQIAWLREVKEEIDASTGKPVTWQKLGAAIGVPYKTLTVIAGKNYNAPVGAFTDKIKRYRDQQDRRAIYQKGLIKHPGYVDMPTSRRLWSLLDIAHGGEMTLICSESGCSKSYVARRYLREGGGNVFMATLDETTGKLTPMIKVILEALGGQPRNSRDWMSGEIAKRLTGTKSLLIIDEAGCGDSECLEQWRHWQDRTKCGIALLGNRDLGQTISGAKRSYAFARLNSRINSRMPPNQTLADDIPIYLSAYGIEDLKVRRMLTAIGLNPRCGGLREIDQTLKVASQLASADQTSIGVSHILDAQESRGLREDGTPS